jgi:AcrR family transcriptional regulator
LKRSKAQQKEDTTKKLKAIALQMFAEQGYAAVAMEDMIKQVGMTRGAIYHHFGSKEGLFRAVLDDIQQEIAERILNESGKTTDLWEQLLKGCYAFLSASLEREIQQIMLIDAPAVLGWNVWRALDEKYSMSLLLELLTEMREQQMIRPLSVDSLTHLLSGAMNEAALWIASAPEKEKALEEAFASFTALVEGIKR